MFNIFNMGIGMVIALSETEADKAMEILVAHGEKAAIVGRIVEGEGVEIVNE
jgi:phosphoribosylformylglycinamidine cyclo-ligase